VLFIIATVNRRLQNPLGVDSVLTSYTETGLMRHGPVVGVVAVAAALDVAAAVLGSAASAELIDELSAWEPAPAPVQAAMTIMQHVVTSGRVKWHHLRTCMVLDLLRAHSAASRKQRTTLPSSFS